MACPPNLLSVSLLEYEIDLLIRPNLMRNTMVAIYVLRLERGKYYVGLTRRNVERIWQHIDGKGAAWTKKYPPKEGKEILSFQDGLKSSDEDRVTLEMMAR